MANGDNRFGIPRFVPGKPLVDQLTCTRLNAILDALGMLYVEEGVGYRIANRGPGGVCLEIDLEAVASRLRQPFSLQLVTEGNATKIRVWASTIASRYPTGFQPGDNPAYLLSPSGNTGYVYGGVSINTTTGEIVENGVWVGIGSSVPANTSDTFYVMIGSYSKTGEQYVVSNARYGPINFTACRDWYASSAPFWGASFS